MVYRLQVVILILLSSMVVSLLTQFLKPIKIRVPSGGVGGALTV
jgi:hypothetical protein